MGCGVGRLDTAARGTRRGRAGLAGGRKVVEERGGACSLAEVGGAISHTFHVRGFEFRLGVSGFRVSGS